MPVPYTFGTATSAIPLSQLDDNFAAPITIGNTAVQLGNTVTTLNNMTLANVTISSGTITITNVAVTTANVSGTANISTLVVVGNETVGGNTSVTGNTTVAGSVVLSGGTANGVAYLNTSKQLTTGSALVFDGTNLGVGITPTTALHVSSASNTFATVGSTNGAAYWQMIGNNATNASYNSLISKYGATTDWSISGGNGTTGQMLFNIGSTEGFRLTSTSLYTASTINVGIGTSSPAAVLNAFGATSYAGINVQAVLSDSTAMAIGTGGILAFEGKYSGSSLASYGAIGGLKENATSGNYAGYLGFYTRANGSLPAEAMRIDSSGNLRVGTTSASYGGRVVSVAPSTAPALVLDAASGTNTSINFYNAGTIKWTTQVLTTGEYRWYDFVAATERARIDTSGNLLVGYTSSNGVRGVFSNGANGLPATSGTTQTYGALRVRGGDNAVIDFGCNSTDTWIQATDLAGLNNGYNLLLNPNGGNLLVGATGTNVTVSSGFRYLGGGRIAVTDAASTNATTTYEAYSTGAGAFRFYVGLGGTVFATSIVITAISDQRLKENVRDIETGLDAIMALKPRRFDWKEGKGQDKKNVAGFIAQEFEDVFPECVSTSMAGADGIEYKNINHETLIPTLVKAIQELKAEFDAYKASHP